MICICTQQRGGAYVEIEKVKATRAKHEAEIIQTIDSRSQAKNQKGTRGQPSRWKKTHSPTTQSATQSSYYDEVTSCDRESFFIQAQENDLKFDEEECLSISSQSC
jgi:murein L,D-transpeptidase YafK